MAEAGNAERKTKIFISYSRKDKIFVRKLNDAIDAAGIDAWVDWEGIELASDWMARITDAIQGGDAFIFVISPDSLKSKVCADELELGIKLNKKIIPVLYREPEKRQKMHPKLSSTNWVYMRSRKDDFKATIPKLVEAIQTDLGWVQQHTRLLQRAAEWMQKNQNKSYLLQGTELEEGERWMTESTSGPERAVVPLQAEYISTSRKVSVQRQRNLMIGVSLAMVVSVIMGIFALSQWRQSVKSETRANNSAMTAVANEHIAATQKALADDSAQLALKRENEALAQRSASEAKIYQEEAGELNTSTLLAIDALNRLPDLAEAENIVRHNISLVAIPVSQKQVNGAIVKIALTPDKKRFVTSDLGGTACIWDTQNGKKDLCVEAGAPVYDSVFSADGNILITGTEDGRLTFWNSKDGKQISSLKYDGAIWDIELNPNERWLGVGRTNAISIIDMTDLKEALFITQNGEVKAIDFDDSGAYIAIGTSNGYVTIWTVMTSDSVSGPKHDGEVTDLAFSPDSQWLVSGGKDQTTRVALTSEGSEKYSIKHNDWVNDVTFGPDSSWFVTVSDDYTARVIETATGQEKFRMTHSSFVQKVRVSPNGLWIATTGYDQTVRIWDAVTGSEVLQIPIRGVGTAINFSADGKRFIIGDRDGGVNIWDISQLYARIGFIQFDELAHEANYSPSGEWLITNSDDSNIWLIKTELLGNQDDGRRILTTAQAPTYDIDVSADSQWVAAVVWDEDVARLNGAILKNINDDREFLFDHNSEVINAVAFTPDNKQLATADDNGLVMLWNVEDGKQVYTIKMDKAVHSLAISPNGKYLAAGLDESTMIWNLSTNKESEKLDQPGSIMMVRFSKDGNHLATGSSAASVYLWNAGDGSFSLSESDIHANGEISAMAFSPDYKWLVFGDSTGYAYIWDMANGEEVARLAHADKVNNISFSVDGKQIATVAHKVVQLWDVDKIPLVTRSELIDTACSRLTSNLSEAKWKVVFFNEPYHVICPGLPTDEN